MDTAYEHRVHASLYRPVLFLGVEQQVMMIEATVIFALVIGVGLHIATLALAIAIVCVVHPVMSWLTSNDPDITRVYLRTLTAQGYYPPRSEIYGGSPSVRASIPAVR